MINRIWKQIFSIIPVLAAASLLCLTLNHFDNKYTHSGAQALDGLLVLSQEELTAHKVHFLVDGWAFYPDVLLSPEELTDTASDQYMIYTSIGEHTRFDYDYSTAPYGCGTYVLHLRLPDTPASYALELPEIYSAYKLYINDELILQLGTPEKETYEPLTQNRIAVFDGSGMVTILLAVSNYSHFYSGLVYPPAFGTSGDINLLYGARLSLALCTSLLGLLGALFACYLGVRMKHQNAFLFALLCLISTLHTCYPLIHTILPLPIHPWYALEITCGCLLNLLVIALQNRLCHTVTSVKRCSEAIGAIFCIIPLCYGLFSAVLTVPIMELFSGLLLLFKLGTAIYLLTFSLRALQNNPNSMTLFYASVFYAAMLLWNRLLPVYEPVLTGWFSEWGSLVMILMIGYTLWRDIITAYSYNLAFEEEHRQTKRQLAMQMEYASQIANRVSDSRRLIHDFRHHLRTVQEMARQVSSRPETEERHKELLSYLETFPQSSAFQAGLSPNALCNHTAVDALLQYFDAAALRQEIDAKLVLNIPDGLPLSDIEWCTVLGNLLENALEGCERSNQSAPILHISTKWTGRTFFLLVENTYDGKVQQKNGRFLSHKRDHREFGVGLESVKDTVEHHGGTLEIYPLETTFRAGITLNISGNLN